MPLTTITKVAERAGVSPKTVSRVVNDEPYVRSEVRERVNAAIAELNYRPNLAARQLAGNRSFLIALVMGDMLASYWSQIALAAATECRKLGYHLIYETFEEDENGEDFIRRVLTNSRLDGIILPAPYCNEATIVAAIAASGTRLVRLAGTGDGYGLKVEVHEHDVAAELIGHLIELGHRRIAMIAPPHLHIAARERVSGYKSALAAAGIPFDAELLIEGDFSFASGATIARAILERHGRPTAIFAANDGMALGALAVAQQIGLSVPRDIAIAGFDDSPSSRMVFPPLTTVRQPLQAMARSAVLHLLGKSTEVVPLRHELLIRGSTSGDGCLVLDALDA